MSCSQLNHTYPITMLEAMILLDFTLPDHRFGLVCREGVGMLSFKHLEIVDLAPRRLYNTASTETEKRDP